MIKTPRADLYKSIENGDVNLKNIQIQATFLLAYRFIRMLVDSIENVSYDSFLIDIQHMEDVTPFDIKSIQGPLKMCSDIIMEFAYVVIGH